MQADLQCLHDLISTYLDLKPASGPILESCCANLWAKIQDRLKSIGDIAKKNIGGQLCVDEGDAEDNHISDCMDLYELLKICKTVPVIKANQQHIKALNDYAVFKICRMCHKLGQISGYYSQADMHSKKLDDLIKETESDDLPTLISGVDRTKNLLSAESFRESQKQVIDSVHPITGLMADSAQQHCSSEEEEEDDDELGPPALELQEATYYPDKHGSGKDNTLCSEDADPPILEPQNGLEQSFESSLEMESGNWTSLLESPATRSRDCKQGVCVLSTPDARNNQATDGEWSSTPKLGIKNPKATGAIISVCHQTGAKPEIVQSVANSGVTKSGIVKCALCDQEHRACFTEGSIRRHCSYHVWSKHVIRLVNPLPLVKCKQCGYETSSLPLIRSHRHNKDLLYSLISQLFDVFCAGWAKCIPEISAPDLALVQGVVAKTFLHIYTSRKHKMITFTKRRGKRVWTRTVVKKSKLPILAPSVSQKSKQLPTMMDRGTARQPQLQQPKITEPNKPSSGDKFRDTQVTKNTEISDICSLCHHHYGSHTLRLSHAWSHLNQRSPVLQCKRCNKGFVQTKWIRLHLERTHSIFRHAKHYVDNRSGLQKEHAFLFQQCFKYCPKAVVPVTNRKAKTTQLVSVTNHKAKTTPRLSKFKFCRFCQTTLAKSYTWKHVWVHINSQSPVIQCCHCAFASACPAKTYVHLESVHKIRLTTISSTDIRDNRPLLREEFAKMHKRCYEMGSDDLKTPSRQIGKPVTTFRPGRPKRNHRVKNASTKDHVVKNGAHSSNAPGRPHTAAQNGAAAKKSSRANVELVFGQDEEKGNILPKANPSMWYQCLCCNAVCDGPIRLLTHMEDYHSEINEVGFYVNSGSYDLTG